MSLRKAIVLLLLAAFSFGSVLPASAIETISETDPVDGIQTPANAPTTRGIYRDTVSNTSTPANAFFGFGNSEIQFSNVTTDFGNGDTVTIEDDGSVTETGAGVITNPRFVVLRPPAGYRFDTNRLHQDPTVQFTNIGTNEQLQANVSFLGIPVAGSALPQNNGVIARVITDDVDQTTYGTGNEVQKGDLVVLFVPAAGGQPLANAFEMSLTGFNLVAEPGAAGVAGTFLTASLVDISTIVLNGGTALPAFIAFTPFEIPVAIDRGGSTGASEMKLITNSGQFLVNPADTSIVIVDGVTTFNFGVDLNTNPAIGDVHIAQGSWQARLQDGAAATDSLSDVRRTTVGAYVTDPYTDSPFDAPGADRLFGNADNATIRGISLSDAAVFTNQSAKANFKIRVVDPDTGVDISGATVTINSATVGIKSADRANNLHGLLPNGTGNIGQTIDVVLDPGNVAGTTVSNESEHIGNLGTRILGNPAGFADDEWGIVGASPDSTAAAYVAFDGTNFDAPLNQFTAEVGRVLGDAQFQRPLAAGAANVFSFNSANVDDRIAGTFADSPAPLNTNELVGIVGGTDANVNHAPAIDANNPSANRLANISTVEVDLGGVTGDTTSDFDVAGTSTYVPGDGAPAFLIAAGAADGSALVTPVLADTTQDNDNYGTQFIFPGSTAGGADATDNVILAAQINGDEICIVPVNTFGNLNQGFDSAGTIDGGAATIVIRPNFTVDNVPSGTAFNVIYDFSGNTLEAGQLVMAQLIPAGSSEIDLDSRVLPGSTTEGTLLTWADGSDTSTPTSLANFVEVDPTNIGVTALSVDALVPAGNAFDTSLPPKFVGNENTCSGPVENLRIVIEESVAGAFATMEPKFGADSRLAIFLDPRLDIIGTDPAVVGTLTLANGLDINVTEILPRTDSRGAVILFEFVDEATPALGDGTLRAMVFELNREYIKMVGDSSTLGTGNFVADVAVVDGSAEPQSFAPVGGTLTLAEGYMPTVFTCSFANSSNVLSLAFDNSDDPTLSEFLFDDRVVAGGVPQTFSPISGLLHRPVGTLENGSSPNGQFLVVTCSVDERMLDSFVGPAIRRSQSILDGTNFDPSTAADPTVFVDMFGLGNVNNTNPFDIPGTPNDGIWVDSGFDGQFAVLALDGGPLDGVAAPLYPVTDPNSAGGQFTAVIELETSVDVQDASQTARFNPVLVRTTAGDEDTLGGFAALIEDTTIGQNVATAPIEATGDADYAQYIQDKSGVLIANQAISDISNADANDNEFVASGNNFDDQFLSLALGIDSNLIKRITDGADGIGEGGSNLIQSLATRTAGTAAITSTVGTFTSLENVFQPNIMTTWTNTSVVPPDVVHVPTDANGIATAILGAEEGDRIVISGAVGVAEFNVSDQASQPQIISVNAVQTQDDLVFAPNGQIVVAINLNDGIVALGFDPVAQAANFTIDDIPVDVITTTGGDTLICAQVRARNKDHTLRITVQNSEGDDVQLDRTILGVDKNVQAARKGGGRVNVFHRLISGDYVVRPRGGRTFPKASKLTVAVLTTSGEFRFPSFTRNNGGRRLIFTEDSINGEEVEAVMVLAPRRTSSSKIIVDQNK